MTDARSSRFAGFGKSIMGLIRRAPEKSIAEQIEEAAEAQAQAILVAAEESVTYSREDNLGFCNFVGDHNRIHRDPEIAKAYKFIPFEDTPIVGVLLASTGARISRNAVSQLKALWEEDENGLKVIGQEIAFKNPAYPEEGIRWSFEGYKEKAGEVDITLLATTKGGKIIELTTRLGRAYSLMPQIAGPILSRPNEIDEGKFQKAAEYTQGEYNPNMIPMLVASFAPSGLLKILESTEGDKEAANLRMDINYLGDPQLGRFQTDMFLPARIRGNIARPVYKFRTLASQSTRPINYMDITCTTSQPINFGQIQDILMPIPNQEED